MSSATDPGVRKSLYSNDPLLILICDKLRLNWWRAALIYVLIWIIDTPLYACLTGNLAARSPGGVTGLLGTLPDSLGSWLWTGTVLLSYYVWSSNAFSTTVGNLQRNGALRTSLLASQTESAAPPRDWPWAIDRLERLWAHRRWTVVAVVLAAVWYFGTYLPFTYTWATKEVTYWYQTNRVFQLYYLAKMGLCIYILVRILIVEGLAIYSLFQIANWRILNYQPFHGDRAGGLNVIGEYRLRFIYLVVCLNVFFAVRALPWKLGTAAPKAVMLGFKPADLIEYMVLICMIPVAFFLPLVKTHHLMKQAKSQLLQRFSTIIDTTLNDTDPSGSVDDMQLSRLQQQWAVIQALQSAPEWPMNISVTSRYLGSWASSLAPILIELADWATKHI